MFAMDAQIECHDVAKLFNGIIAGGFEVERFEGERLADFGDRAVAFGINFSPIPMGVLLKSSFNCAEAEPKATQLSPAGVA
jgi:hypothetical protein